MQPARALFYGSAPYHLSLLGPTRHGLALHLATAWPGDGARGEALLRNGPPRDDALHGFHWLSDLAALRGEAAARTARQWAGEWLRRWSIYDPLAWRSDLIGDRLFAWIEHFDLVSGDQRAALLASMGRQARHLSRVAAHEGRGVPRLRALRGLVAASVAIGGRRHVAHALAQLGREIGVQFTADGGHRARSPETQLAALRLLVDARTALTSAGHAVPDTLQQAIERAASMARFFRHGDGKFALFNGASEGDAAKIDLVLARAAAKGQTPLIAPETGFARLQAGGTSVIFDCGKALGFDTDAHAGIMAFEMGHGRERLIVNCGDQADAHGAWHQAMRASAAHSTLIVGDTNSAELQPNGLGQAPENVTFEHAEQDGALWVAATHDGYRKNFGLVHGRQLFLAADGEDLRGEDSLTGTAGRGFAIRFHLHPAVGADLLAEGGAVRLRSPAGVWRLRCDGAVLSLGESIYLGTGMPQKSQQILLDGHVGSHGAKVRWAIRRDRAD